MGGLAGVARSGLAAALLHPMRSAAIVACVVGLLVPLIAGLAIAEGLRDQAADAARLGADIVVAGERFGRPAPLPLEAADRIRAIAGVSSVRARVTGTVHLGAALEPAVVVGVEGGALPAGTRCVEGAPFDADADYRLVVGARLARRLGLAPGSKIPPFYRNRSGERVCEVVGIFRSDLPMWEANLVFASFATAQALFDERGTATEFLVECADGYDDAVRTAIARLPSLARDGTAEPLVPRVRARGDAGALLAGRAAFGGGVYALHFVLLLAAAVPLLVVATGAGLRERRREVGVLKMLGWGTDEVLLRGVVESIALAALGGALSILLAALWLGPGGARGIAAVLLPGTDADPGFAVPWRMAPGPALVGAALALVLVLAGTIPSGARAAAAEPMEAMR
ncbi:MAG TPA: ABC transporter permease [Planctomycetota bacterium]|nr:ABC transporter permease [Planctomycetota bacterium]